MNEQGYLDSLREVIINGEFRKARNANTLSSFGIKLDFDIKDHFPLLTTKKMFFSGVIHELLWFIKADTNSKNLEEKDVNIWKANSTRAFLDKQDLVEYEEGDCGPIYGFQWRHFNAPYRGHDHCYDGKGIDQLQNCIDLIRKDPYSRRIFMSAWNPCQMKEMCLPPCHISYQFYVSKDDYLSCILTQRSGDMFLGIPFNIASVALLVNIIANMTDKKPGKISIMIGDAHIYDSHIGSVLTQLDREPFEFPTLRIKNKHENINDYVYEDFEIVDYVHHPAIKAKMVE